MPSCAISVRQTPAGYLVRLDGRGTMQNSPTFRSFVDGVLEESPTAKVEVDLSACEYLDSTFLGSLVALHKHFNRAYPPRFVVLACEETRGRLLRPLRLDRVLPLAQPDDRCRGDDANWSLLTPSSVDTRVLGHHVMDCHRRLAELGGPCASAFERIADQLASDLEQSSPPSAT